MRSCPPCELPALRTSPAPNPEPSPPTTDARMRSSTIGVAGTGIIDRKADAIAIDMSVVTQNFLPITLYAMMKNGTLMRKYMIPM